MGLCLDVCLFFEKRKRERENSRKTWGYDYLVILASFLKRLTMFFFLGSFLFCFVKLFCFFFFFLLWSNYFNVFNV